MNESGNDNAISERSRYKRNLLAFAGLLCCLLICYANSFHTAWQYDDFDNIIHNANVHMDEFSWTQIARALSAGLDFQTISRPLAYLSFALNYRFGQTEVYGYHAVNFTIHWLAAIFLFLFVRDTLNLPIFNGRYEKSAVSVAWLSTLFWAVHPIQVTAVTYIVQRMASLTGLFYILSMYLYLVGRRSQSHRRRTAALVLCALSTLCALLTKENAVLVGFAILLFDIILIQGASKQSIRRGLLLAVGVVIIIGAIGLLYTDPRTLLEPYANRPFSMVERLLSQPRVLFLYLSLLIVPMTSRMTIIHDIEISHSILDPWVTVLAIGGWVGVIILLIGICKRYPLISYCGLFFLINHLVEGSIFNLEMAYEHRNYIPSMLIFVPLALAASKSAVHFQYSRAFQSAVGLLMVLMIVSLGYTTFSYNRIFRTELTLWHHAVQRAPRLSLTHNNLGNIYWNLGLREQAQREFQTAFKLDRYFNLPHKALVYHNLGLYAAYQEQDYHQALAYFSQAKELYDGNHKTWYQTARMQIAVGDYSAASNGLSKALAYWPRYAGFHHLAGLVFIKKGNCAEAVKVSRQALAVEADHLDALAVLAQGYRCQKNLALAIQCWQKYIASKPRNLLGILALIELYEIDGDVSLMEQYVRRLLEIGGGRSLDQLFDLAVRDVKLGSYEPDFVRIRRAVSRTIAN